MVAIDSSGCHESAGFDDAAKQHWRGTRSRFVGGFLPTTSGERGTCARRHIMPVGKFKKPENAMRTPIYNCIGGGDRNSSRKDGRGGGKGHRYDKAFTEWQECSNMQGCHQLQIT